MTSPSSAGWVVRQAVFLHGGHRVSSWWTGPDRSWGHSFGPLTDEHTGTLSMAVAVFPSRRVARQAMALVGLRGCVPVRIETALDELFCQQDQDSQQGQRGQKQLTDKAQVSLTVRRVS